MTCKPDSRPGRKAILSRERDWKPTEAPPGSEEKIRVMAARARLELPLFHPDDSTAGSVVRHGRWRFIRYR